MITNSWVNVVSFTYNTNTNTSSIDMHGIDILGNLSNTVAPGSLVNYQPLIIEFSVNGKETDNDF